MNSVIACKSDNLITVIAVGDHMDLEGKLPIFENVVKQGQVRLVDTSGMNLTEVLKDQQLIQEKFEPAFQ